MAQNLTQVTLSFRCDEEYKNMKEDFKAIGKRHVDFDIQEFFYCQYYRALVQVLQCTTEEEKAWRNLYTWFSKICVEAHRKESRKRKRRKEEKESRERLEQQLKTNDSDLPTEAQRVMVTNQLKPIQKYKDKKFDEKYFKFVFEQEGAESLKECFPKKTKIKDKDGKEIEWPDTSGCKVKECVLKSVGLQSDLEKLMEYLEPIGLVHAKHNVPDKHYYAAWLAFMHMIPKMFPRKDLYPELQMAWKSSFNLYTTCMLPDDDQAGGQAAEQMATIEAD